MKRIEELPDFSTSHRFLDEAGDPTFFRKGRILAVGEPGISLVFSLGMVKFSGNLDTMREQIRLLQNEITQDGYLNQIPSVSKKIVKGGFYFHATDDSPEVRERMFRLIRDLDCSLEMVVARKIPIKARAAARAQRRRPRRFHPKPQPNSGTGKGTGTFREAVERCRDPLYSGIQRANAKNRTLAVRGRLFMLVRPTSVRARGSEILHLCKGEDRGCG